MPLSRFIRNVIATSLLLWVGYQEYGQHGMNWQPHIEPWCFCFAGFVMFIGAEEFAEYTGRYGASNASFYTQPVWYVRSSGCVIFVCLSISLLLN